MKICFIGSSGHYTYVFEEIKNRADVEIAGIAPGCPGENMGGLIAYLKSEGYVTKYFDSYQNMLDTVKPDIAVVIPWFGLHAKIAIDAMESDCHVFMDKPVATSLSDLEAVKSVRAKTGHQLAAMFGIRYAPNFLAAKKAIEAGAIGKIRLMNAQKSYKLGERADYYRSRETYGGTIPWVAIHAIDWLYWLSGERFLTVSASHSASDNKGNGDLEMCGICHFTMTNEISASVNFDYLRPANAPTHEDDRIRIAGTEGVLELREGRAYLINGAAKGVQELPGVNESSIFADFIDVVNGSRDAGVTAQDSFYVTEAALLARQAADDKRIVTF